MCTSHVCAHRTLQRVPLNTRYTFKQSSMFNGVGINCSCVAMCTCRCVHRTIKRSCEARYTKPAALEASAAHKCSASSAKQLSAQVLCTSAALMREHILPAFLRTSSFFLSFFHFSFVHVYIIVRFLHVPFFLNEFCRLADRAFVKLFSFPK